MVSLSSTYRQSFPLRLLIGFAAAGFLLTLLGFFTKDSHLFIPNFDDRVGSSIRSLASPGLTAAMRLLTRLGSTVGLTVIGAVVIAVLLYMRKLRYIALLLLVMAGQAILQYGFKYLFDRQRPEAMFDYVVGDTPSFPSGHALAATCFFGLLAYLFTRELSTTSKQIAVWAGAVLIILIVGFSRVYFDVHYPSDVLASYLAGTIWACSVASGARS